MFPKHWYILSVLSMLSIIAGTIWCLTFCTMPALIMIIGTIGCLVMCHKFHARADELIHGNGWRLFIR